MKTVLLIDDDEQVRTTFGLALRKSGFHVIEADSDSEGLKVAREFLPDLILSDINMPGGNGSNLLRDIRLDPELRSKQVVLMTGRPDLVTPRRGMEDGADDFLLKPVSMDALRRCVEARFSRASISWRVEDRKLADLRSSIPAQLPHEFFTPLAGIIGLMEILQAGFPELSPEVQDINNDVYHSALRLHRTLRNYLLILDIGQPVSASICTGLSSSEAGEGVQIGLMEALRLNPRASDIVTEGNTAAILVEQSDLSRITEELIDNACKFSRQGTPVNLQWSADGTLSVTDKGRGLTVGEINRVGAFQQFDRKKYEQQGLGLGLVLVQKLVNKCGAKFSMESTPGEGTEVQIIFRLLNTS